MIGHDLEMENSEMGTSIGVYNTVKGYNSMAIGNHNIADGTNADNSRNWTAIAIGSVCNALSHGNGTSVAMGAEVTADGQDAVAFGYQAKAKAIMLLHLAQRLWYLQAVVLPLVVKVMCMVIIR